MMIAMIIFIVTLTQASCDLITMNDYSPNIAAGTSGVGADGTATSEPAGSSSYESTPVLLTIYLFDQCGGCETEGPGCGQCKVMDRIQGAVRAQLGDRLYDGSIEYRTFNSRTKTHALGLVERRKLYGVPDEFASVIPITFIGTGESGLYLLGDALIPYIGEMLDRYIGEDDIEAIQGDAMKIYHDNAG